MTKTLWLLSAGAAALAANPAFAQDQTPPADASTSADLPDDSQAIVITAQGRRQVLQDVPIAVSVVNAESLQNSGATDIRALNQLAPSLLVSSTGSEANGSARIRGIGTVGDNPGLESSVAVFIDGVYRSRTGIGLNELGEIERVEVLRGPQGTLFGRNASAGLINIISRRPEFEFGGFGEVTYGNYDNIRVAGAVTGPISESVAFRIDGVYNRRDGFYDVVNASGGTEDDVNDRNRYFLRGQLLFEPNDQLSIRLIGDYTRRNESCCGAVYISTRETFNPENETVPPTEAPGTNPNGNFSVRSNRIVSILNSLGGILPSAGDPYSRDIAVTPGRTYQNVTEDWGLSGQVDYDFGDVSLTSITAYRRYRAGGAADIDYGNVDIAYRADDGNAFRRFETFSQELRFQGSAFNGVLDWLVGGYYANEDLQVADNTRFGAQYGAFASCRIVATVSPVAALRNPAAPGCLSPAGRAALTAQFAPLGPVVGPAILAGLDRLSTVNNVGDIRANYFQSSENFAIFTHNIINITDQLSLTLGARYTSESKDFSADFNNNNNICPVQQQNLTPVLQGVAGNAALPAATRATLTQLIGGIITLTCQGNSSTSLNALDLADDRSEDEFTGTAVLSYQPTNNWLLYASYSRGYKAGGFNLDRSALGTLPVGSNPTLVPRDNGDVADLNFEPELVDAFEAGLKYTSRNFTFNAAVFHQLFSDFQLNTFNGSVFIVQNISSCGSDLTGGSDTDNLPTGTCDPDDLRAGVTSTGIEMEAVLRPHRDLQIALGYTYAETKFRERLVGTGGIPLDTALFLLSGDNMSNAPEHVVTASLGWTPDIGSSGLSGLFYVDGRLTSDYNTGSDLAPEKEQDGYFLMNARVGIRGADQRWSVELWAQNLLDTNYTQVGFNTPFQGAGSVANVVNFGGTANQLYSAFLAEPRTYGITGRFRF